MRVTIKFAIDKLKIEEIYFPNYGIKETMVIHIMNIYWAARFILHNVALERCLK
jgi:hypothetical protein